MSNRTPLTRNMLTKPFTFTVGGVDMVRSPMTEDEINSFGLTVDPRHHTFSEVWHQDVLESVEDGHPIFITGPSGTGKDYLGEAVAYIMGKPLILLSIKPDLDPNEWVGGTGLSGDGVGGTESVIEEGFLSKACKGYEIERNGKKITVGAVILVSDFDRATPRQAEVFRQAFEEKGRRYLTHPTTGDKLPIHDDTIFLLTANSGVDGDGGRGNVTSQLDTSIVNRCIGVLAPPPSAKFEREMVQLRYPQLDKAEVALLVKCLRSVRGAVHDAQLPLEISLRTANMVAKKSLRRKAKGMAWEKALREGFRVVSGFMHEADNRAMIEGALDPIIGSANITSGANV
ncbi:MAG: hypothetical protein CMF55_00320 [Legionellales bacterium]|nr:hypothetical protein [Legionellales bacterium]